MFAARLWPHADVFLLTCVEHGGRLRVPRTFRSSHVVLRLIEFTWSSQYLSEFPSFPSLALPPLALNLGLEPMGAEDVYNLILKRHLHKQPTLELGNVKVICWVPGASSIKQCLPFGDLAGFSLST